MKLPTLATLATAALFAGMATGAESPAEFAWRLPLATSGDAAHYRIDLPANVYEGIVHPDLSDLRVFNGDHAPVPIALLAPPGDSREAGASVDLALFPLRVAGDGGDVGDLAMTVHRDANGTTFDVRTRNGTAVRDGRIAGYLADAGAQRGPLAALTLVLPAGESISTRVRVEGSDDLVDWRPLAASAPLIAVESGGRRLAHERIELARLPAKYLRITFEHGQPAPALAAARGELASRVVDAPRQWRQASGAAVAGHPGDYAFDLGGRFPVDRVTLALPEINTVAPATLLARADPGDEWRPVGALVLYRLHQDGGDATNPPLAVTRTPLRYWMLRVDPASGGLGGKAPTLSAGWVSQSVVFAARGNGPFELAYGSAQAKPVALPVQTLVPGYDNDAALPAFAVATVGASSVAPAMAALRPPLDVKRWALWATLALATLVLGWMAWRLTREMSDAPK